MNSGLKIEKNSALNAEIDQKRLRKKTEYKINTNNHNILLPHSLV